VHVGENENEKGAARQKYLLGKVILRVYGSQTVIIAFDCSRNTWISSIDPQLII
jgi:hypothetical protein